MKKQQSKESGFTIIEVVLVLAIAGLIFLVVFLALPALQRSQRDSQRRSDLGRFMAQLETYASNNNGSYPTVAQIEATGNGSFIQEYMTNGDNNSFADPLNGTPPYNLDGVTSNTPGPDDTTDEIFYRVNAICHTTEGEFRPGNGNRSIAAMIALENGIAYCQDNQ